MLARGSKVNSLPATRSSTVWETSTWDGSASAEIRAPPWTRSALLCGSGRRPPRGRRPMGQSTAMFAAAALAGISRMRAGLSRSASRKDGARREGRQGSRGSGDCRLSRGNPPVAKRSTTSAFLQGAAGVHPPSGATTQRPSQRCLPRTRAGHPKIDRVVARVSCAQLNRRAAPHVGAAVALLGNTSATLFAAQV